VAASLACSRVAVPQLTTTRLLLRAWREDDLDDYAAMCADPEVMRFIGSGTPLDRADSWRWIALTVGHWELRGFGQWALESRSDGTLVGRAGLWQPEGWPGLEVGWALARSQWGHGFATEAGQAAIDFAWRSLHASEIISLIQPDNIRSQRVAGRLGLQLERRQRLGKADVFVYRRHRD